MEALNKKPEGTEVDKTHEPIKIGIKVPLSTYISWSLRERMSQFLEQNKPMTITELVTNAVREFIDSHDNK